MITMTMLGKTVTNKMAKHKRCLKGGEKVENKLKITYEAPNLKIVLFGSSDVITTSGPLGGDGSPDYEEDSWTKA